MKSARRLGLLASGLLIICSSQFAWSSSVSPMHASLFRLVRTILRYFHTNLPFDIAWMINIKYSVLLFCVGVIMLVAATLGHKSLSWIAFVLSAIIISIGMLVLFIGSFNSLNTGFYLALAGILVGLFSLVMPRFSGHKAK